MNFLLSILFCFAPISGAGQDAARNETPPGITVGKYKWERVTAGPGVDSSFKAESDSPGGATLDPNSSSDATSSPPTGPGFAYFVEIKNGGNKAIRAILWDYLINDSRTNDELGRHEFVSFEKVGRGSTKTLTARSRLLPCRLVTVEGSPPTTASTVVERVVLKCVVYDDGTAWEQTPAYAQSCEVLRKRARN